MALILNVSVNKTVDLLETSGKRELFWYGVTIGQFGFGVLVSRLRQPTKRAADLPHGGSLCEVTFKNGKVENIYPIVLANR